MRSITLHWLLRLYLSVVAMVSRERIHAPSANSPCAGQALKGSQSVEKSDIFTILGAYFGWQISHFGAQGFADASAFGANLCENFARTIDFRICFSIEVACSESTGLWFM
jgi:hypothetical protein